MLNPEVDFNYPLKLATYVISVKRPSSVVELCVTFVLYHSILCPTLKKNRDVFCDYSFTCQLLSFYWIFGKWEIFLIFVFYQTVWYILEVLLIFVD